LRGTKPCAKQKVGGAALGAGFASTAGGHGWQQPPRELVDQNQVAAGTQDSGAFDQSSPLIGPVIE
jgi:hypothetical protein